MAKKKQPVDSGVGLLELRLGACLTGPTKRAAADLHAAAAQCNRVRNAIGEHWLLWRRQHPDWTPESYTNAKGQEKNESPLMPHALEKELRDTAAATAPELAAAITTGQCIREVTSRLTAKMPWNHWGQARRRWQAILAHEVQLDNYRSLTIPLHNNMIRLCYAGIMARASTSSLSRQIFACGQSAAVVAFQLFSLESGRKQRNLIFRVEARQLTPGNRRVLKRVAAGEWKLSDSRLVWKEAKGKKPGAWFLQLTYQQPRELLKLDSARTATLRLQPDDKPRPFEILSPDEESRPWYLGLRALEAEYKRLEERRRILKARYRDATSARKGHGRQRANKAIDPLTRGLRDLMERFTDKLVAEVINFCAARNCGTLLYREPSLWLRSCCWFSKRKIPYDWNGLLMKLKQKCWHYGVELIVERTKKEDNSKVAVSI